MCNEKDKAVWDEIVQVLAKHGATIGEARWFLEEMAIYIGDDQVLSSSYSARDE